MSSAGMVSGSNAYWKGTDYIERKLGSVLDRKVASSTKQVLIDKIHFKEASKPDPFYTELKNKYTPLNNPSNKQNPGGKAEKNAVTKNKDELPTPKCILFEREKIHLHWKTVRRVGPGLSNLGNTCFLNSVIQVLTYTPPLVNYLSTQEHSKTCRTVGFCMLCELQRHVLRTFGHNQNEAIKPMAILQKLKYIAKHLRYGYQEDSHEFLRYVIDGMLKSCLAGVSEKLDRFTKETTMVHQVFGGYFRSQVTCERCQHISNTYDPLMEILLDIKHAHTVTKALYKLTTVELLSGDNMYLCPRCKRKVPAKKHLTVHRAPNVMTVCLKRFDCHSLFGTKLNKEVNYPDSLNLRPFMSKNQGPAIMYKLYGVLVHSGYSCNSGHYYCFIKASNNTWYQMNDSTVRQVGLKTVLSQQAYLLFYIRDQNTPREKADHAQQAGKPALANGVKPWKPGGLTNKQNTPKIINEPKEQGPVKGFDKGIGEPVPRKPDHSLKENHTSTKQYGPAAATPLPQTREKISFTLNLGTQQKRPTTPLSQDKKNVAEKSEEQKSATPETHSLVDGKEQQPSSVPNAGETEGRVEGKENNSSVQDVNTREEENVPKQEETKCTEEELREKDVKQASDENSDAHATTKWNVTNNETLFGSILTSLLPGSTPGSNRERTPSLSSDVSNACSIASKTGDWAVTDRSITQDVGPRLPERQHAGWMVSAPEDTLPMNENEESREKTPEKLDEDEERRKPKKRKHSKETSKKSKVRKTDDETKLLSDECRESSEDEEIEEKREKKIKNLKKVKKEKKRKSGSSGHDTGSSSESEKRKKRKKGHKKSKKKKKRKQRRSSEEEHGSSGGGGELSSDNGKNKDITSNSTKIAEKAKELMNKVKEVVTNKKHVEVLQSLVQYSDHSSSGDENAEKVDVAKGSSDLRDEKDVRKNEVKSWSCGEMSSASGRSRDDRKRVVDTMLEKSRGSLNYGCDVGRWDGEKEERWVKNEEENSKRRRDEWDDEYDQGKTKRVKTKDHFRNRSYHGENSFQREHDRRRMRNNGWYYSTPSSSTRWHNRSTERHSRR